MGGRRLIGGAPMPVAPCRPGTYRGMPTEGIPVRPPAGWMIVGVMLVQLRTLKRDSGVLI